MQGLYWFQQGFICVMFGSHEVLVLLLKAGESGRQSSKQGMI